MTTYRAVYKIISESIVTSDTEASSMTDVLNKISAEEDVVVETTDPVIIKRSIIRINECPDLAAHAAIEQGVK
jgi:hypothetical protein